MILETNVNSFWFDGLKLVKLLLVKKNRMLILIINACTMSI